eukprot:scaffold65111_cov48-Attheya_sp.AAC.2
MAPWQEVAVDLIVGPWKFKLGHLPIVDEEEAYVTFNALTCIDPMTNLTELIWIDGKTATHIGAKFEQGWLSRYPRPIRCIYDKMEENLLENIFSYDYKQTELKTFRLQSRIHTS